MMMSEDDTLNADSVEDALDEETWDEQDQIEEGSEDDEEGATG